MNFFGFLKISDFFLNFENILIFFGFCGLIGLNRTQQGTDTAISAPFEGLINSFSFILPNWRRKPLKLNLSRK